MSIATQVIPEPPQPTEFKLCLDQVMVGFGYLDYADTAKLVCTLCDEILCGAGTKNCMPDLTLGEVQLRQWALTQVIRHQAQKHPEKLHVYTSAGWVRAGWLLSALQGCEGK